MAEIDLDEIRKAVTDIINAAAQDDTLEQLTQRIIRQKVESEMGLEPDSLSEMEYKSVVKNAVEAAMKALDEPEEEISTREVSSSMGLKPPKNARKASKRKSDSSLAEESATPPSKKAKPASKLQSKKAEGKSSSVKAKNGKAIRSPSVLPSSDEEEESQNATPTSPSRVKRPSLPKNQSANDADVSSADVDEPATQKGQNKPKSKLSQSFTAEDFRPDDTADNADPGEKSGSESSATKPKAFKRKKEKTEASAPKKKRKSKDAIEESPEDQEIKRLKSYVVACGTRKQWAREFKDILDDKKAQIKRLKEILTSLGMTGRLSLEKAKSIKEQREFAQELEDVQKFEAVVNAPRASRPKSAEETSAGNESDIEDLPDLTGKKRVSNARASIMAFLGDQSDDE